MTVLGQQGDGDSSRQTWMCGHPSSEGPPDPRQSKQNEHLGMPGKAAALSPETIRRDELFLCLVPCKRVRLGIATVCVVLLLPEGDKANTQRKVWEGGWNPRESELEPP